MIVDIDTLIAIDNWGWLLYFAALIVLFAIFMRKKYLSSSLVAILITTVITWFMNEYQDFMLGVFADKAYVEQNRTFIRYAWYYGFVVFNTVLIFTIYKVHIALKLSYSYIARYLILAHFILSLLQITRLLERQSFQTNYLDALYQWGIVSINLSCTVLAFLFALTALYKELTNKTTRGFL